MSVVPTVQCLFDKTHRGWQKNFRDWSIAQHCVNCFSAAPNQYFPHSSKMWGCRWVELPSDTLLNQMFFNLILASFCYILIYSANSFSTPSKFVPLSLFILDGLPLRAMNRITALKQLSVSSFGTISICTARTVRHVNKQHQSFSFLRPIFTVNGPK